MIRLSRSLFFRIAGSLTLITALRAFVINVYPDQIVCAYGETRRWMRVWHDVFTRQRVVSVTRVFFWDENRDVTGVVILRPDRNQHVRALHGLIEKLVASEELRAAHRRDLCFRIERFYAEYSAFPEEEEVLAKLERPT